MARLPITCSSPSSPRVVLDPDRRRARCRFARRGAWSPRRTRSRRASAPTSSRQAARRSTPRSPRRSRSPSRIRPPATSAAAASSSTGRPRATPVAYDFREMAPAKASPTMFLKDGQYNSELHHNSHLAVGVPGTVAGLHLAWKEQGKLPWKRLVEPAIALARDGFVGHRGARALARSASAQRCRSTRRRWRSSRRTACRTKPARR